MTPENGSTGKYFPQAYYSRLIMLSVEIWLGTHNMANLDAQEGLHGERASGRIKAHLMEERQKISPPFQPVVPKGVSNLSCG